MGTQADMHAATRLKNHRRDVAVLRGLSWEDEAQGDFIVLEEHLKELATYAVAVVNHILEGHTIPNSLCAKEPKKD